MDVIGDIVTAMRTGAPLARKKELHGRWGLRFVGDPGAGLLVVLKGAAWMLPPMSPIPVRIGVGDVVFARSADGYTLADHPDTALIDVAVAAPNEQWPLSEAIPGQQASTSLLCGVYALDRTRPHPLIAQLPAVIHLPAQQTDTEPLRSVINLLSLEVSQYQPGFSAAVPALLDLLLLYVLRTWYAHQADVGAQGWAKALSDPAIASALGQIQRSPDKPWTVAALAADAAMSRSAFARQFSKSVGEPPLTYLTRWRMNLAGRLLRETDLTLGEIASRVGYRSDFAFSKAFRKLVGTSPGNYRRVHRPGL